MDEILAENFSFRSQDPFQAYESEEMFKNRVIIFRLTAHSIN